MEGYLGSPLSRVDGRVDALAELRAPDEEQVLPLLAGDEDVVLVLALFARTVPEGGNAVAVLAVGEPLALVLEAVAPLADAEARSLVVLPFAHVRFRYARVQMFVLNDEAGVGVGVQRRVGESRVRGLGGEPGGRGAGGADGARPARTAFLQLAGTALLPDFETLILRLNMKKNTNFL